MSRITKLAIGTAQFGLTYGIANTQGKIGAETGKKILALAQEHGLHTIDTAIAYGNSEETLGNINVCSWQVISKLPEAPANVDDLAHWVESSITASIHRLGISSLYGFLLHRPLELTGPHGPAILRGLRNAQRSGLVNKIGVSIYAPNELETLPLEDIAIVQAPLNILDRRLIESGWAKKLKERNIELHTRSVFLQGLLLMPPETRPAKFARWNQLWTTWDTWLADNGLTALQACLGYALSLDTIDRIVVGVDSSEHLQQILAAAKATIASLPTWPTAIDEALINPSRWNSL